MLALPERMLAYLAKFYLVYGHINIDYTAKGIELGGENTSVVGTTKTWWNTSDFCVQLLVIHAIIVTIYAIHAIQLLSI